MELRVPYTQQFSPQQTPLARLLPILRDNTGNANALKNAIASAFFKDKADPAKLAGNTLIALRSHGILDGFTLTEFGEELVQDSEDQAHLAIARNIIVTLDGYGIIETLREMKAGQLEISLTTLPGELRNRGYRGASDNSSDLSGVFGWLRRAGLLTEYTVNEAEYAKLVGTEPALLDVMKGLAPDQVAFLRAMLALNITDWCSHNVICDHAAELYAGEMRFNRKEIVGTVVEPLRVAGLIEYRKKSKRDIETPEGRGGKPGEVKPTSKFETSLSEPLLGALYRAAGFTQIREIRSKSLAQILNEIEASPDHNKRAKALEWLAIRLCQLLDLDFMRWRETDIELAGGGEVDAFLHSVRLIYSRWQLQCKIGQITVEAVQKEVGASQVSLANVILIVGTGRATLGAQTFRRQIISKTNLNIIIIDGPLLLKIIKDNSKLVEIMRLQARDALAVKPQLSGLSAPNGNGGGAAGAGGNSPQTPLEPAYKTDRGRMFCGDSLQILPALIAQGVRAKVIITSPPFALLRKKAYGNEDADRYVEWFAQFIPHLKGILDPAGSLIIDIGGSWIRGLPVRSTYHLNLLLTLCQSGFYLAQDFYHYNPARLPTPAEWVTIRRIRLKDAVNSVFWLTQDPFVDADNRRVLAPYSDSMKSLLKNGYKPQMRPSGHDISDKFQKDNGGAIRPNLLTFGNTASTSYYLRRCKEAGIKAHPARFPQALPEFFIDLLTKPGDLILDPFAGSNVTGAAAEARGREWIGIELDSSYVAGSKFHFEKRVADDRPKRKHRQSVPQTPQLPFARQALAGRL